MIGFISKMFGGSKSEKDVKQVTPIVEEINKSFSAFQTLSNDQLRGKTQEFRKKIQIFCPGGCRARNDFLIAGERVPGNFQHLRQGG